MDMMKNAVRNCRRHTREGLGYVAIGDLKAAARKLKFARIAHDQTGELSRRVSHELSEGLFRLESALDDARLEQRFPV